MPRFAKYSTAPSLAIAIVTAVVVVWLRASDSNAGEQALQTPASSITPSAGNSDRFIPTQVSSTSITQDVAVDIALEVAAAKGDPNPELVSVAAASLKDAIAELSPGMELPGYNPAEPVFVVKFKGGPFQHARSIPANRKPSEFITNGVFVVIRIADGDVIGTGALRY